MRAFAWLTSLVVVLFTISLPAQAKGALDVYKAYLAVAADATTLDQLLPYYTKDLREGLPKMPKEMQDNYIKMRVPKLKLVSLNVTRQSITGSKATFDLVGKTADGREITGQAVLVKEGEDWKIDEDAWAVPMPPPGV
jgi:hypothetical protein